MKTISLDEIKISKHFLESKPRESKVEKAVRYLEKNGRLDKPIVLNKGILVDNYARYLAAKLKGLREIPYVELQEMTYIIGKHNKKEYTWKNDRNIDIKIGDLVFVRVKHNGKIKKACVKVFNIFSSDDLDLYNKHRSVVRKIKQ
jgi:hypothetical protein